MANPTLGAFTEMKKVARYLIQRVSIIWEYRYQDPPKYAHLFTDSDWGGTDQNRKSTSGGAWMLGNHCMKTWSAKQGAVALRSAEAEFCAMVEGVTRAKGLTSIAREWGLGDISEAAKQFV